MKRIFFVLVVVAIIVVIVVSTGPSSLDAISPIPLDTYPPLALKSGEFLIEDEQQYAGLAAAAARAVVEKRHADNGVTGRGDHSTSHGCYPATFTLEDDLPEALVTGIASAGNLGREFDAIVRFSNSDTPDVPDKRSASQGIAVKVLLPNYPASSFLMPDRVGTQDFLTSSSKTFLAKTIAEYATLFARRVNPALSDYVHIVLTHPDVIWSRVIMTKFQEPPVLLQRRFWTALPYGWGNERSAKYSLKPCENMNVSSVAFDPEVKRYQTAMINDTLGQMPICHELLVQLRPQNASEAEYPIEDAAKFWPITPEVPYQKVATLTIRKGQGNLPADECEKLEFSPWNGLQEHQPLSNLQRARFHVYATSRSTRHSLY